MKYIFFILLLPIFLFTSQIQANPPTKKIILFIWDGLRPDSVTPQTTPNLYALMKKGVEFTDNHSSYPTFTMMNASSFATGDFAGKTGFFGNVLWHPQLLIKKTKTAGGLTAKDCSGKPVDFGQPVYTEDYKILQELDQDQLVLVGTLFSAAHHAGLITATVGKSGPAFFQGCHSNGIVVDEKHVSPLCFAQQLQKNGYALPKLSTLAFPSGELTLSKNNGDPTAFKKVKTLCDGVTTDPSDQSGSPFVTANQYLMNVYLHEVLTAQCPNISVIWLRDPDSTEHNYGPGSFNHKKALAANDQFLGNLLTRLRALHLDSSTDLVIVSDHAHSSVSGPLNIFPLRNITNNQIGEANINGYSVSGEIRAADLLTKSGFHAYDGEGCRYNPILSGITADGTTFYPTKIDNNGTICGKANAHYTTPAYKAPCQASLPTDTIIVAANGGSDYFYLPSHNKTLMTKLVTFLQSHNQFDAIFVDSNRYGSLAGTLPLSLVNLENPAGRSPDVIVGLSYDNKAKINGLPGIEYSDSANYRGMHGSFSPIDVHNFLIAYGPDFRQAFRDKLPTGNVDVAPTIANILHLNLPNTDGRVLLEALANNKKTNYQLTTKTFSPKATANHLQIKNSLNQITDAQSYTIQLKTKLLTDRQQHHTYIYFDSAKAVRH